MSPIFVPNLNEQSARSTGLSLEQDQFCAEAPSVTVLAPLRDLQAAYDSVIAQIKNSSTRLDLISGLGSHRLQVTCFDLIRSTLSKHFEMQAIMELPLRWNTR